MAKFRKKPVVIEAVRFTNQEYADSPFVFDTFGEPLPYWVNDAIQNKTIWGEFHGEDYWYLAIKTPEGKMVASPGDMIIQGVKGELYPYKPDIFNATYERA